MSLTKGLQFFLVSISNRIGFFIRRTKKTLNFFNSFFADNRLIKSFSHRLSSFFKILLRVHRILLITIIILISLNSQAECIKRGVFILENGPHKGKALMCDFAKEYFDLINQGRVEEASKWLLIPIKLNQSIESEKV